MMDSQSCSPLAADIWSNNQASFKTILSVLQPNRDRYKRHWYAYMVKRLLPILIP